MSVPIERAPAPPRRTSNVAAALEQTRLGLWRLASSAGAAAAPLTVVAGGATAGWAVTHLREIPLAYLLVAVLLWFFSVGYLAMSRRIVNRGAFYSYVSQGLGRIPGVAAAMVALEAYNTMEVGLAGGFGWVLHSYLDSRFGVHIAWWVCAGAAWTVVAVLGLMQVELSGTVLSILLVCEVVIAVVLAGVQVAHPAGGHTSFATLSLTGLTLAGLAVAACIAIAGFVGFESAPVYSEEARNPRRTVPTATYLVLGLTALVYAGCSWAMSDATGPDKIVDQATTQGPELTFSLAAPYLPQFVTDAGHLLLCTSLFAAMLSFHNTSARYAYALGRERVLPAWLGRTSRTGAPLWGSLTQTAFAGAVLLLYAVNGWDPYIQLFFFLTVVGGAGVLILMVVASVAVVVFFASNRQRRTEVSAWQRIIAPLLAVVLLGGVLYETFAHFDILLGVPATSVWRWAFPASFAVLAVIGVLRAVYLKVNAPTVYDGIGHGLSSGAVAYASGGAPVPVGGTA